MLLNGAIEVMGPLWVVTGRNSPCQFNGRCHILQDQSIDKIPKNFNCS